MEASHKIDKSRLAIAASLREAAYAELTAKTDKILKLREEAHQVSLERSIHLDQLGHVKDPHQNPARQKLVDQLTEKIKRLKDQMSELQAAQVPLRERFQSYARLHDNCRRFLGEKI